MRIAINLALYAVAFISWPFIAQYVALQDDRDLHKNWMLNCLDIANQGPEIDEKLALACRMEAERSMPQFQMSWEIWLDWASGALFVALAFGFLVLLLGSLLNGRSDGRG